jgi:uncharacterized protein YkwD
MRKLLALAATAAVGLLLVACTPDETNQFVALNQFRTQYGIPTVDWDEALYGPARSWSQHMADTGQLSHPTSLKANFNPPPGWRTIGQNVAVASSLESAFTALKKSPGHRANMHNRAFTRVAIGIVYKNGRYWITQNFIG